MDRRQASTWSLGWGLSLFRGCYGNGRKEIGIAEETEDKNQRVVLLNLVKSQYAFREVVEPSLYRSMDYTTQGDAALWFPQHPSKVIVLDPARSFGRPIVARYAIPAETLAAAAKAEGSAERAARRYDISVSAVRSAVKFQQSLAA
jgi:uncharacterized protein (DUF433 family)